MNRIENNPFDPIAREYDQWFDTNQNTYLSELEAIKFFSPDKGKGIEIGVGTGRFASALDIRYGLEPSENMATLAKQRGIEVTIGHAEELPYADESFDFALMVTVDCFVQDLRKAYQESYRILKNGGRLIVGTFPKEGAIAQKYIGLSENGVYKYACFRSVTDTIGLLKECRFKEFKTCQTLFSVDPEKIEQPIPGYDKGSFVVIEALKSN